MSFAQVRRPAPSCGRACRLEPLEDRRLLAGVPELVLDPATSSLPLSDIRFLTALGEDLYFSASSSETGRELWASDGTTQGVVLVKDVFPGPQSGLASAYTLTLNKTNGVLVFAGDDGEHGLELWHSLKAHFGERLNETPAAAADGQETGVVGALDEGPTGDAAAQDSERATLPESALAPSLAGANTPPQAAGGPTAAAAVDLLPDLITWSDEDRGYLHGWTVDASPTRTLLRLTTGMANIGTGPLELRGSASHPDGTQDVLQRIFRDDGTRFDRLAGTFVFHASHNHIHFEDFTEYNLRAVLPDNQVGEVVATSDKVSFCLVDFDDYDETLVGAPDVGAYHGCSSVQGISVGWADIYEEGLPDQWIDVTDVPAGQYWLEVIADPANHVLESNEDNNVARILIDYPPAAGLLPDRFEPNDSGGDSRNLGNGAELRHDDLTIHAVGNNDVYDWTAPRAGVLTVGIQFEHAQGDLSLLVYRDGPVEEIGLSISDTNVERVIVPVSAGAHYYFSVIGAGNATSPNYSLSLTVADEVAIHPADAMEPNNTVGRATRLASADVVLQDLSIHSTTEVDWFRWVAPTSGPLQVSAEFSQAAGNLDLLVYDRQSRLLGSSTSLTDQEHVTLPAVAGQIFLFKVVGRDYGTSPAYSLIVDGPEVIPGDADLDGDVDLEDFAALKTAFGSKGEGIKTDFNRDRQVDLSDFGLLKANFSALVAGPPATALGHAARTRPVARDPRVGQEAHSFALAIEAAFEQGQDELWWQKH